MRITPWPARVVYTRTHTIFGRDFTQWYASGGMDLALDVDAFAGRKRRVEIGGILEFELGGTHSMLPSSVLSESGSRGRSLGGSSQLLGLGAFPLCFALSRSRFAYVCRALRRNRSPE